ncbi:polysaccharide deacetylase family protein [Skermania piniformis]|uniref:Polysaccharide deacetylase family protein n=1 Tax=Skermania pinensis TaxID=39122 RepID=A0ABX8SDM8_9ACTN|nr:polysaccharide deacetylase family protein [Skermania piniformis]QXQ15536.1 polysaccharide deacetylase family protein [Skermania piniformis]
MDRRRFLTALAAGTVAALAAPSALAVAEPSRPLLPTLPGISLLPKIPVSAGTLTLLPNAGQRMALTVDDGENTEVVAAFIQFARDTGARFTFFVTGRYASWAANRDALRPLVESGQIQLANHTWSHADLAKLPERQVADDLVRCQNFLRDTFGVDGGPYLRLPYGSSSPAVVKVAADLGYPRIVDWSGQLEDTAAPRTDEPAIVDLARTHFKPGGIVLCTANDPAITHTYGQLIDVIRERKLELVTLNDVLLPV